MNAYTTIEESKQLIEAGLDVDTADMFYSRRPTGRSTYSKFPDFKPEGRLEVFTKVDLPCWSLAALIELLSDHIEYWDKDGYCYDAFLEISKYSIAYRYFDQYQNMKIQLFEVSDESLVSGICKTIIWLIEHCYINYNKNE